jgi:hypothetical protein
MNRLEDDLRSALRRREPPAGFADRVMARVPVTMTRRRPSMVWRWVSAAAACLMLAAGVDSYRDYRRGVEAKQQLMLALKITGQKLAVVQNKIHELNRSELR